MTDPYAEYVELCNKAFEEAVRLEERYRAAGNGRRARMAGTAQYVLELERDRAERRDVPESDRFGYGPGRFADDTDWGPEGDDMLDAISAMQHFWKAHF